MDVTEFLLKASGKAERHDGALEIFESIEI